MRQDNRAGDGFTLIEAMIATFVFMIAFLGLVALEGVAITGAARAKAHTGGVNVAQFFMTRLQNEVSLWPAPPLGDTTDLVTPRYKLLSYALGAGGVRTWLTIPEDESTLGSNTTRIGEYLGHSEGVNTTAKYCVNYRVDPLGVHVATPSANDLRQTMVWKIRVRVAWPKSRQHTAGLWDDCDPDHWDQDGARLSNSDVVELMSYATRERARGRVQ